MKRFLPALFAYVALLAGCSQPVARLDTYWAAPTFALTDATAQSFSSQALAGKVWMVDFIYTNCTDACPIYLTPKMKQLQQQILAHDAAGKAALVSITVDPQRDTPAVLARYAAGFGADPQVWYFLTGPVVTINDLLQNGFKVGSSVPSESIAVTGGTPAAGGAMQPQDGYTINHTTRFLLVDQSGKVRAIYDAEQDSEARMWSDMQALLAGG